jgi:ubiquinone/menaquinone biosynthesis C-methylase UbiE
MPTHPGHVPGPFQPERLYAREEARRAEMPPEELLREFMPDDARTFVDLGCGSGYFTVAAARTFPALHVLALDRQHDMLEFVARRAEAEGLANVETVLAEAPHLPLAGGSVDVLLMSHVFHDIEQREAMRDDVFRVLRPGGVFFLVEWEAVATLAGPPLGIRIGRDELSAILTAGGFQVERIMPGPGSSYRLQARKPA